MSHAMPRTSVHAGRARSGFTLIELLVVLAIVGLLASIAAPRYLRSVDAAREKALRSSLVVMRDAIDQYAADRGSYPDSIAQLAETRYLRSVPVDPITGRRDSWIGLAPRPGSVVAGRLADIRSGAAGRGSDGRLYADW